MCHTDFCISQNVLLYALQTLCIRHNVLLYVLQTLCVRYNIIPVSNYLPLRNHVYHPDISNSFERIHVRNNWITGS
jgi:hypothetical protein